LCPNTFYAVITAINEGIREIGILNCMDPEIGIITHNRKAEMEFVFIETRQVTSHSVTHLSRADS
jgi:hypothetical protein